jgi:hypothetical protein
VEKWVDKLSEKTSNLLWKRNINAHANLLLKMVTKKVREYHSGCF